MLLYFSFSELQALHKEDSILPPPLTPDAAVCVVIGNFDGVHLGHQSLFEYARTRSKLVIAVTFDPHPRELLGSAPPPRLISSEDRNDLLMAAGAEHILVLRFDHELAALSPERFVREILVDRLRVSELVLGYDFMLGKGRSGNAETLRALGREMGFSVAQRPGKKNPSGEIISSTAIRNALLTGDVKAAAAFLGRAHTVRGTIVHGQRRGAGLGFPTANLDPSLPGMAAIRLAKPGVYATRVTLPPDERDLPPACLHTRLPGIQPDGSRVYPAVTNVGFNPTFGINSLSVETHIPGLHENLYGKRMELAFLQRLRSERRFTSLDELKAQLAADTREAMQVAG